MICPNHNGPMCTTCRLGGLIRCPVRGTPLPLVAHEKVRVERKRRLWPEDLTGMPPEDQKKLYDFLRARGIYE